MKRILLVTGTFPVRALRLLFSPMAVYGLSIPAAAYADTVIVQDNPSGVESTSCVAETDEDTPHWLGQC